MHPMKPPHLYLPADLEPFRARIEATVTPCINITATDPLPATADPTRSRFGGTPYWPAHRPYPQHPQGNWLWLLAQIDFAEVPPLQHFPDRGLLQFFIADNDLWGMDMDHPFNQDGFRVVYHHETDVQRHPSLTDFSFLGRPSFDLPFESARALEFIPDRQPIANDDYRFADRLPEIWESDDLCDLYGDVLGATGHRLGGYPFFTQTDPRAVDPENRADVLELLFQMDSDEDAGILWGDVGVCNFFIDPEALQRLDFSNVLYNWDCS